MIQLYYFDWKGTKEELKKYCSRYKKACEKHKVVFKGCYAPPQEKWHYVIVVEAPHLSNVSYDVFNPPFYEVGKSKEMTHGTIRYLVPTEIL